MARRKTKFQKYGTKVYQVFPSDSLPKPLREKLDVKIKGIKTGEEAKAIAGNEEWSYLNRAIPGSVGILCYRGSEVALFYKRHLVPVRSEECDPFPQNAITDPKEAWVRVEFLHSKPSVERNAPFMDREKELLLEIDNLKGLVKQRGQENDLLHSKIVELDKALEEQTALAERFRNRYLNRNKKKKKA